MKKDRGTGPRWEERVEVPLVAENSVAAVGKVDQEPPVVGAIEAPVISAINMIEETSLTSP